MYAQYNINTNIIQNCMNKQMSASKQMSKKQSTRQTTNKQDLEQTISQIFHLFDTLFQMRLIDKICRPIESSRRLLLLTQYKQKFNDLHQKLDTVLKQTTLANKLVDSSQRNQQRSTRAYKAQDIKTQIRKIQSRYIQLFRDGSFKFYDKVSKIYALPQNLYLINIQQWAHEILDSPGVKKSCC